MSSEALPLEAHMNALPVERLAIDPAPIAIRPAVAADVGRLTEIYNFYVTRTAITFDTEPFTAKQRMEWFSHYSDGGRHRILVAEHEGVVLGYTCSSRFHLRAAYDTTVETTSSLHRKRSALA